MKKIYFVDSDGSFTDNEFERLGECQIFFDEKGDIIAAWVCNDANYRPEYMNCLLWALGYQVEQGLELTQAHKEKVFDWFGC